MELSSERSEPAEEHAVEPAPEPAASEPTTVTAGTAVAAPTSAADGGDVHTERLAAALDRLVDSGVLNRSQAGAVRAELAGLPGPPRPGSPRRLLGEIAGYLGASFVVGATLLFLGQQWDVLGRTGRFSLLAVMAVVLVGSGLAVRRPAASGSPGFWRRQPGDDVRRRLSSTLLTAAAAATGFAAYVILEPAVGATGDQSWSVNAWFVASIAGLLMVIAGYLLARSALGQLGMAVAAFAVYSTLLDLLGAHQVGALGVGTLLLGALWAGLAWRRLVAERSFALAIAVTFGLIGAQIVVFDDGGAGNYVGHALTALVAGICFTAYARIRDWVLLAGGVTGATLVVPEFLHDVTGGSLGASGVMLVAGVTLLAGSLVGLRMRHEAEPGSARVA